MKRITKIILSLMAVLCIALYTMGVNAQEIGIGQPNMDSAMSLKVNLGKDIRDMFDAIPQEDGSLCYDLYRIADVIGDGFTYQVTENFSDLEAELSKASTISDSESAPDWRKLAQQALKIAVGEEGTPVNKSTGSIGADYTGLPFDEQCKVGKGLYLFVARGTLDNKSVVKSVSALEADGGSNYEDAQCAVAITAGAHVYTIYPLIVCVPTKVDADGSIVASTVENGDWLYDQHIELKMSVEPALGSIQINKTLTGHTGDEEVVCIFQVDAYYPTDDKLYSSEVYSVTFDADGDKSLLIEGLPIGAKVDVKEVYSGANYIATVPTGSVTVSGSQTVSIAFKNTRDNERSGGGITNHFTYNAGNWNLEQTADNTQTINGNR